MRDLLLCPANPLADWSYPRSYVFGTLLGLHVREFCFHVNMHLRAGPPADAAVEAIPAQVAKPAQDVMPGQDWDAAAAVFYQHENLGDVTRH